MEENKQEINYENELIEATARIAELEEEVAELEAKLLKANQTNSANEYYLKRLTNFREAVKNMAELV